jgi:hypothetical protein
MKRDMDLVRSILLAIEACNDRYGMREVKVDGYSDELVSYHLALLYREKMISGAEVSTTAGYYILGAQLEWKGHEFLDAARSDTIWNKAKVQAKEKGLELGSMGFGLLVTYLKRLIAEQFGIPFE